MQFEQFLNCKYMYSQVTIKYVNVRLLQLRLMDLSRSHSSVGNSNSSTISQHHQQMATTTQTKHPRLRHQLNHHVSFQSSDSPQYCIDIDNDLHLRGSSSSDEANNSTCEMTPIQQRVAVANGNASSSPHPPCTRSMSLPYPASASVARANCIREFLSAEQEYVKLLGNLVEVSNLNIE